MRHDETRARSAARAEAFEEAAAWLTERSRLFDSTTAEHGIVVELVFAARAAANLAKAARERAAHAPKPPVRYTEAPEQSRASMGPWSARESITDCVEDGWTTEHVTGWPGDDLKTTVAKLRAARLAATDWPDSYPFEALDPWPDNPAEACK
jgi:hypothetical protein